MLNLLNLKPDAFGIAVSDLSVKLIKLKKTDQDFELASYGEQAIPVGVIEKGEVKSKNGLVEAIKKLLNNIKGDKLNTHYAAVSLPEEKSFLKNIKMPQMSMEDLEEAVYFEIENYIPLRIEDVYFDFKVIPSFSNKRKENHLEVLFAAISKNILDDYIHCLKTAGIQPIYLETESLPLARSLVEQNKERVAPAKVLLRKTLAGAAGRPVNKSRILYNQKPESILLINLSADKSNFVFCANGFTRFACSSAVCAGTFTQAISRFLKVDLGKAEELKEKYGFRNFEEHKTKNKNTKNKTDKNFSEEYQVFQALIPSITDLTEQVRKYIDFYNSVRAEENEAVNKIIISGSGACLKGISRFLENEIGIPVERGNPWINVSAEPFLSLRESYKYAAAIGIALGAAEE